MSAFSLSWAPLLPWPLLAGLGLLTLLALGLAFWRRARGVWWRSAAALVLLLALFNPALVEEQRQPLEDVVLVIADQSQSQTVGDRAAQRDAAVETLMEGLAAFDDVDARLVRAGEDATGLDSQGTQLFAAARRALSQVPSRRVAAILMVSDGQVHDVPPAWDELGVDAPLHLLLTGERDEGDRRLTVLQAPSFGIVGNRLTMKLRVDDLGAEADARRLAPVVLRQDGVETQRLQVPVGREQELEFELTHRGPTVLELEAAPGPRELSLVNNRTAVEVKGVRDRLRVLLVSGEPHAGERAWRNILKSDPSVDLVHFTILRPPEKQDGTPIRELSLIAFPTRELFEIKLDEFDLIIFDRYRRRGVLPTIYLDNIARYVEQGGALLEAVGPTFATPLSLYRTPLGRILPAEPTGSVYEEGFRPRVTELGRRHPVTAELDGANASDADPEWGRWFRHVDAVPREGDVVMSGLDERPLLILDRVGEGRVAQFLSDHMWLWSRGFEGGGPQAELLRRIAHWLMKEPDLEEEDLRATVDGNRLRIERRSLTPETAEATVTLPSGETREVVLEPAEGGRATAAIEIDQLGLYEVRQGELGALAAAGPPNPLEFADLRASAEPLAPLLEASGGGLVRLAEAGPPDLRRVTPGRDRHGSDWLGVLRNGEYVVTGTSQVPLLPGLLVLLAGLGALALAWHREGR